ncbi:uncharacterized protein YjiS (DUF1127 family) [Microvirga flocculans]|uniref:Uncharacterized protein YjiS (DUF1127 family) n=1 Tax=Microvirga flocculans TaxID=217168 RepID=A0A7W6II36_9HYPH|nr:hypothetical protein [Microvirga flocculans]MBB4041531.1 uncharacterized protein YjiS (DUF1127 family) [Microvirga flocculans]
MRGTGSVWLRLTSWLKPPRPRKAPIVGNLTRLSDHERRDIGLSEPLRFMDWRALADKGPF